MAHLLPRRGSSAAPNARLPTNEVARFLLLLVEPFRRRPIWTREPLAARRRDLPRWALSRPPPPPAPFSRAAPARWHKSAPVRWSTSDQRLIWLPTIEITFTFTPRSTFTVFGAKPSAEICEIRTMPSPRAPAPARAAEVASTSPCHRRSRREPSLGRRRRASFRDSILVSSWTMLPRRDRGAVGREAGEALDHRRVRRRRAAGGAAGLAARPPPGPAAPPPRPPPPRLLPGPLRIRADPPRRRARPRRPSRRCGARAGVAVLPTSSICAAAARGDECERGRARGLGWCGGRAESCLSRTSSCACAPLLGARTMNSAGVLSVTPRCFSSRTPDSEAAAVEALPSPRQRESAHPF